MQVNLSGLWLSFAVSFGKSGEVGSCTRFAIACLARKHLSARGGHAGKASSRKERGGNERVGCKSRAHCDRFHAFATSM